MSAHELRWAFKADRPRSIDRIVNYFGEAYSPVVPRTVTVAAPRLLRSRPGRRAWLEADRRLALVR
jgi:hypothetical protein